MAKGAVTAVQRNPSLGLCESDLFFENIRARLVAYRAIYPDAKIISLAVGDASEPIPEVITSAMGEYARGLSTPEGFSGYGCHQGVESLRNRIVEVLYKGLGVKASEVFVSDGAKGGLARLQILFGPDVTVAVQDPSYAGIPPMCHLFGSSQHERVVYMKSDRDYFPDLVSTPRTDLIYLCCPNNPTGTAATRRQLEDLVAFAKRNGSIIIYDGVYSAFVSDKDCPKSIYEIPGAREVAIEVGSFSKLAGFTGVRLGWAVVPESICFSNGQPILKDFHKVVQLTFPAGPSNVVQAGGLACLTPAGLKGAWLVQETMKTIDYYKENARILIKAFGSFGLNVCGGRNSPYLWVEFPGRSSDDVFDEWLVKAHILTCPGCLFGQSGDGFLRISAFGHREDIVEAIERLKPLYPMLPTVA